MASHIFTALKARILGAVAANNKAIPAALRANNDRLFILSLVAIPVNLVHIIVFYNASSTTSAKEALWRTLIIVAHGATLVVMTFFAYVTHGLRRKAELPSSSATMHAAAISFVLLVGSAIVAIDQLITASITPFLVACVVISGVFLLRPLVSGLMYLIVYAVYHYAIGLTQLDGAVLLSNRVNGITAVFLGFGLSLVLWTAHRANVEKTALIDEQQRELAAKNQELAFLATHDSLTGLLNRRAFELRISQDIADMQLNGHESSVLLVDIDNFKRFNDSYGHPVGDAVLRHVANTLKNSLRGSDVLSRWGGEEFLLLLPHTDVKGAYTVAEKLKADLEQSLVFHSGHHLLVTASFGVAPLYPRENGLVESYRQSDEAMRRAKHLGKNRVEIAG